MIKIFVMKTCPDCTHVKKLAENDPRFEITDIGEHVRNLKQFITLRDSSPAFDDIRGRGTVGIPCFVLEDGRITFSPEEAGIEERPGIRTTRSPCQKGHHVALTARDADNTVSHYINPDLHQTINQ